MTGWIAAVEGSAAAPRVAMALALLAAVTHAVLGALQKGRHDPWLTRGAIDLSYSLMALPVALCWCRGPMRGRGCCSPARWRSTSATRSAQAMAYSRGAFTVVYPIVRGTGPLVTVLAAGMVFGEHYTALQWVGVLMLSGGIFALAGVNLGAARVGRGVLAAAVGLAFVTGLFDRRLHHLRRLRHPGDARSLHLPRLVLRARRRDLPLDRARALPRAPRPAGAAGR